MDTGERGVTDVSTTHDLPLEPRLIGRSLPYRAANLPLRLRRWHAPRINRWERLRVTSGPLLIEYLLAGGAQPATLATDAVRWFAPGTRWRVAGLSDAGSFTLETHAAARGQAEAPEALRADVLLAAQVLTPADPDALARILASLPVGVPHRVEARFPWSAEVAHAAVRGRRLFWHPLRQTAGCFAVFVVRSAGAFDLPDYLGRDHALIEAALGGALAGNAECTAWLRAVLERHLHIEEELLFPAWLEAGGPRAEVADLLREHVFLRQYLGGLDQALSRRRLLRLLDGHDEKEERAIYPVLAAQLAGRTDALLEAASCWPPQT